MTTDFSSLNFLADCATSQTNTILGKRVADQIELYVQNEDSLCSDDQQNSKKWSPAPAQSEFIISAMFLGADQRYTIHWFGFDKLIDFTVEPVSDTICENVCKKIMNPTVADCYPWDTAEELLLLKLQFQLKTNKLAKFYSWIDLWMLPCSEFLIVNQQNITEESVQKIQSRQKRFFEKFVKAMWLMGDKKHYLLHISVDALLVENETIYDEISKGFFVCHIDVVRDVLDKQKREKLTSTQLTAQYPWKSGQEGYRKLLHALQSQNPNRKYQNLNNK